MNLLGAVEIFYKLQAFNGVWLLKRTHLDEAKKQLDLLKNVVEHKSLLFASKKASYETIYTEGLKLLPDEERIVEIQNDYREMGLMIFGEIPSFETVIDSIKKIEIGLNNEFINLK